MPSRSPMPRTTVKWGDASPFGWLDMDGVWMLPIHQPVEGNDFTFETWDGTGCAPLVCEVCSYDQKTGLPTEGVTWPCAATSAPHTRAKKNCSLDKTRVMPRNLSGHLPSPDPYIGPYQPLTRPQDPSSLPSTSVYSFVVSCLGFSVRKKLRLLPWSWLP